MKDSEHQISFISEGNKLRVCIEHNWHENQDDGKQCSMAAHIHDGKSAVKSSSRGHFGHLIRGKNNPETSNPQVMSYKTNYGWIIMHHRTQSQH